MTQQELQERFTNDAALIADGGGGIIGMRLLVDVQPQAIPDATQRQHPGLCVR